MNISFAWTTPAVAIGQKTNTRRDWSPKQIALAKKQMEGREPVEAWTKSARFGGKPFGQIRILDIIENEPSRDIPDDAWEKEGFHVLTALEAQFAKGSTAPDVWRYWRSCEPGENLQTVVVFELIDITALGLAISNETEEKLKTLRPWTLSDLRESVKGLDGWERA